MGEILAIVALALRLILLIAERTKDLPPEERKKFLAAFDSALEKAKKGDARELSIWLGKRL